MRENAAVGFLAVTNNLEGYTPFMYLDILGWVTTGIGNLIENTAGHKADSGQTTGTPGGAFSPFNMKWRRADGSLASRDEIQAEWDHIKSLQEHRKRGGGYYRQFATLHLDDAAIDEVVQNVAGQFERTLASRFTSFNEWPCDAQVATMGLAWAYGPGSEFQGVAPFLRSQDWHGAALKFPLPALNGDRNRATARMYSNAAMVVSEGLDPDLFYYPKDLANGDDPQGGGGPIARKGAPQSAQPNPKVQASIAARLQEIAPSQSAVAHTGKALFTFGAILGIGYLGYTYVKPRLDRKPEPA